MVDVAQSILDPPTRVWFQPTDSGLYVCVSTVPFADQATAQEFMDRIMGDEEPATVQ